MTEDISRKDTSEEDNFVEYIYRNNSPEEDIWWFEENILGNNNSEKDIAEEDHSKEYIFEQLFWGG